jgi:hypothetical protein
MPYRRAPTDNAPLSTLLYDPHSFRFAFRYEGTHRPPPLRRFRRFRLTQPCGCRSRPFQHPP